MANAQELVRDLVGVGLPSSQLTVLQASVRAAIVFVLGIAIVRFGSKRFLGKNSAFDALLAVMIGSVLARAINGSAGLGATFAATATLVALHWVLSALALRSEGWDTLVKGHRRQLISQGQVQDEAMRRVHFNRYDLQEALHLTGKLRDPSRVEAAFLERSGEVSVLPQKSDPHILEIQVEAGVQTVRIRLE